MAPPVLLLVASESNEQTVGKVNSVVYRSFNDVEVNRVWLDPLESRRAVALINVGHGLQEPVYHDSGQTMTVFAWTEPATSLLVQTSEAASLNYGTRDKLRMLFTIKKRGGSPVQVVRSWALSENKDESRTDLYEVVFQDGWEAVLEVCSKTWMVGGRSVKFSPFFPCFKEDLKLQLLRLTSSGQSINNHKLSGRKYGLEKCEESAGFSLYRMENCQMETERPFKATTHDFTMEMEQEAESKMRKSKMAEAQETRSKIGKSSYMEVGLLVKAEVQAFNTECLSLGINDRKVLSQKEMMESKTCDKDRGTTRSSPEVGERTAFADLSNNNKDSSLITLDEDRDKPREASTSPDLLNTNQPITSIVRMDTHLDSIDRQKERVVIATDSLEQIDLDNVKSNSREINLSGVENKPSFVLPVRKDLNLEVREPQNCTESDESHWIIPVSNNSSNEISVSEGASSISLYAPAQEKLKPDPTRPVLDMSVDKVGASSWDKNTVESPQVAMDSVDDHMEIEDLESDVSLSLRDKTSYLCSQLQCVAQVKCNNLFLGWLLSEIESCSGSMVTMDYDPLSRVVLFRCEGRSKNAWQAAVEAESKAIIKMPDFEQAFLMEEEVKSVIKLGLPCLSLDIAGDNNNPHLVITDSHESVTPLQAWIAGLVKKQIVPNVSSTVNDKSWRGLCDHYTDCRIVMLDESVAVLTLAGGRGEESLYSAACNVEKLLILSRKLETLPKISNKNVKQAPPSIADENVRKASPNIASENVLETADKNMRFEQAADNRDMEACSDLAYKHLPDFENIKADQGTGQMLTAYEDRRQDDTNEDHGKRIGDEGPNWRHTAQGDGWKKQTAADSKDYSINLCAKQRSTGGYNTLLYWGSEYMQYCSKFLIHEIAAINEKYPSIQLEIKSDGFMVQNSDHMRDVEQDLASLKRQIKSYIEMFAFPRLLQFFRSIQGQHVLSEVAEQCSCHVKIPDCEIWRAKLGVEETLEVTDSSYGGMILGVARKGGLCIHLVQGVPENMNVDMVVEINVSKDVHEVTVKQEDASSSVQLVLPEWSAPGGMDCHIHFNAHRSKLSDTFSLLFQSAAHSHRQKVAVCTRGLRSGSQTSFPAEEVAKAALDAFRNADVKDPLSVYICEDMRISVFNAFKYIFWTNVPYHSPTDRDWESISHEVSTSVPNYTYLWKNKHISVQVCSQASFKWHYQRKILSCYPISPNLDHIPIPLMPEEKRSLEKHLFSGFPDGLLPGQCAHIILRRENALVYCCPEWGDGADKTIATAVDNCLRFGGNYEEIHFFLPQGYPKKFLAQKVFQVLDGLIGTIKKGTHVSLVANDQLLLTELEAELRKRSPEKKGLLQTVWSALSFSQESKDTKDTGGRLPKTTVTKTPIPSLELVFLSRSVNDAIQAANMLGQKLSLLLKKNTCVLKLDPQKIEVSDLEEMVKDANMVNACLKCQQKLVRKKKKVKVKQTSLELTVCALQEDSVNKFIHSIQVMVDDPTVFLHNSAQWYPNTSSESATAYCGKDSNGEQAISCAENTLQEEVMKMDKKYENSEARSERERPSSTRSNGENAGECGRSLQSSLEEDTVQTAAKGDSTDGGIGETDRPQKFNWLYQTVSKESRTIFQFCNSNQSQKIERAYRLGKKGGIVNISEGEVNLDHLTAMGKSGVKLLLRQEAFDVEDLKAMRYPDHWSRHGFRFVKVDLGEQNFTRVTETLNTGLQGYRVDILRIEAVENSELFQRYNCKKRQMGNTPERTLWHRVSSTSRHLVCEYGLHYNFMAVPKENLPSDLPVCCFFEDVLQCFSEVDITEERDVYLVQSLVTSHLSHEGSHCITDSDAQAYPSFLVTLRVGKH